MKNIKFLFISGLFFIIPFFALANLDHLVISQVQITGGAGKTDDDFIELFNPTGSTISLAGMKLISRAKDSQTDHSIKSWNDNSTSTIPAYSFYLWVNNGAEISLFQKADLTTSGYLSENYGVALVGADGNFLDSLSWGNANNGINNISSENPLANEALLRQDLFAASFVPVVPFTASAPRNSLSPAVFPPDNGNISDNGNGQSGSDNQQINNTTTYPTTVKISEIMPNPSGVDDGNEAVELFNNGTSTVDISGWLLSDSHGTSTAYQLPTSTAISAQGFLVIAIPAESFTLNNNEDAVNLYYPNGALADLVSYNTNAGDDKGWQMVNGAWVWGPQTLGSANQAPPPASSPSSYSSSSGSSNSSGSSSATATLEITEIMPNPSGDDEGKEWVEFYNFGSEQINLINWVLDDSGTSTPGSGSFTLDGSFKVLPKNYLAITIPKGKFVLNNSGKDTLRLFKPGNILFASVEYENPLEGLSFSRNKEGGWSFASPTPGEENIFSAAALPNLIISELLPNPAEDDEEFVEIFNAGTSTVPLLGIKLCVGARSIDLGGLSLEKNELDAGGYLAIYESDLPFRLSNKGQTVVLKDSLGREISRVVYEKAKQGQAFAYGEAENYFWTDSPTPGVKNDIILAASTVKEEGKSAENEKVLGASTSSNKDYEELLESNQQLQDKIDNLELAVANLTDLIEQNGKLKEEFSPKKEAFMGQNQSLSRYLDNGLYLLLSFVCLCVLIVIIRKFFKKNPKIEP